MRFIGLVACLLTITSARAQLDSSSLEVLRDNFATLFEDRPDRTRLTLETVDKALRPFAENATSILGMAAGLEPSPQPGEPPPPKEPNLKWSLALSSESGLTFDTNPLKQTESEDDWQFNQKLAFKLARNLNRKETVSFALGGGIGWTRNDIHEQLDADALTAGPAFTFITGPKSEITVKQSNLWAYTPGFGEEQFSEHQIGSLWAYTANLRGDDNRIYESRFEAGYDRIWSSLGGSDRGAVVVGADFSWARNPERRKASTNLILGAKAKESFVHFDSGGEYWQTRVEGYLVWQFCPNAKLNLSVGYGNRQEGRDGRPDFDQLQLSTALAVSVKL